MGKVEKTRFERNWTTFVNRLFTLLGKAQPKWWYETNLVKFDSKGVFSFCPDGESRKNALSTQLDDLRATGFLRCLEKPSQNGGMKPTSWNSIPRCFFVSPRWGKSKKTRFERNWTTFVNPAFCAAWKSPAKMVVWNPPRKIRTQGCFFVSPRWGKSKKRVLNAIGRPSSTYFLRSLEKPSQNSGMKPTSWNSIQGCFFVSPRWRTSKKRILNAIGRPSYTRLFALLGKAQPKWWYETHLVGFDPKGVFSFRPDGESRKNTFWTQLDDLRQPAFYAAWKSPAKMVVWNQPRKIRFQGCFFVLPRWGKSKKRAFNAIGRPSWTGFLRCLEKPSQNGGRKPTS